MLTNYWIVSGLLLGLGQVLGLQEMGVASQLGARLGVATKVLTVLLVAGAAGAVLIGREFRLPAALLQAGAIGGAIALMVVSYTLGRPAPHAVEAASPALADSGRPNIVLIVMDTVHADHSGGLRLRSRHHSKSARPGPDGMVYTDATSAADITLTTHASLFTGMYPSWHGSYCDPPAAYGRALSSAYPTIAELLHRRRLSDNRRRRQPLPARGFRAGARLRWVPHSTSRAGAGRPQPLHAAPRHAAGTKSCRRHGAVRPAVRLGEDINTALFVYSVEHPPRAAHRFSSSSTTWTRIFPTCRPRHTTLRYPGRRPRITQDDLEDEQ